MARYGSRTRDDRSAFRPLQPGQYRQRRPRRLPAPTGRFPLNRTIHGAHGGGQNEDNTRRPKHKTGHFYLGLTEFLERPGIPLTGAV